VLPFRCFFQFKLFNQIPILSEFSQRFIPQYFSSDGSEPFE